MQYHCLSNLHISQVVDELKTFLEGTSLGKEDCIRTTFAIEEALLDYQSQLGEQTPFAFVCGKKWGKTQFTLTVCGAAHNPFEISDDATDTGGIMQTLMGRMGIFPTWDYDAGKNVIHMVLPKVSHAPLKKMGASIAAAFVIYAITLFLPQSAGTWLYTYGITPLSDLFTEVLRAISGPIIFCSIACSVAGMGDIATFGKIGKRTIAALVGTTCLLVALNCGWLALLYPPTADGMAGGNAFFEVYQLLLSAVPTNLLGAFVDNNPMQIVTMAIVLGIALLALSKKTRVLTTVIEQCNHVLQYVMEFLSEQIHLFIFLSVLGLLLSGQISILTDAYLLFVLFALVLVVTIACCLLKGCIKVRTPARILIKKLAPTFLIAFTTASSAAAFSVNLKTCKEKLGISPKLAEFGIPFGQVIYMPATASFFAVLGFYLYDTYALDISIPMLFMLFLLCVVLSIALPPIPGGALIVLNLLFLQLGIPTEGLSLAIIASTLSDFPDTAINVTSLQIELLCTAKDLNLLDEDTLKAD